MAGQARIIKDPNILRGHPVIEGTRIPVWLIQEQVATGSTEADILRGYPHLTPEGIAAALRYAEEHGMGAFRRLGHGALPPLSSGDCHSLRYVVISASAEAVVQHKAPAIAPHYWSM